MRVKNSRLFLFRKGGEKSGGFSFFGYLLFIALLGVVVFAIVTMVTGIARSAERELVRTTAVMLAEGKIDAAQGMPFAALGAEPRASFGGGLKRFSYTMDAVYVEGPADLVRPVARPTPYKKVTVVVYHDRKPYARLTCVRTARE